MLSEVKTRVLKFSAVVPSRLEERAGGCKSSAWLRHGRSGGFAWGGKRGDHLDLQRPDRMVQPPRKGDLLGNPGVRTGALTYLMR